ncbi:MAG TPA: hypothetical protein DCZ94_03900 [Lentisphaeria bacterium]|nr:MAG: hypothetical protein A2X48_05120 [Lentisphaerae bacterium GWF2_49_21]HBC86078.1 hypothetical protein [Lentisphaeria bacterium]
MDKDTNCRQELESLLESLERIIGIRVTLQDPYGFFCDEKGNSYLHPDRVYHRLVFCQNADRQRCMVHEWKKANETAGGKTRPFLWPCWLGPQQILIPLRWQDRHVGSIFLGPFVSSSSSPARQETVKGEKDLPRYDMANFEKDSALFEAIAIGIIEKTISASMHGKGERWEKIFRLVINRYTEKIGINDAAKELNLSASRASHLVRELFGMPFERVVLEHRLRRSAALLESTDLSLSEIADSTGFCDVYHLCRMFKRKFKIPPGKYRAKLRAERERI